MRRKQRTSTAKMAMETTREAANALALCPVFADTAAAVELLAWVKFVAMLQEGGGAKEYGGVGSADT